MRNSRCTATLPSHQWRHHHTKSKQHPVVHGTKYCNSWLAVSHVFMPPQEYLGCACLLPRTRPSNRAHTSQTQHSAQKHQQTHLPDQLRPPAAQVVVHLDAQHRKRRAAHLKHEELVPVRLARLRGTFQGMQHLVIAPNESHHQSRLHDQALHMPTMP